MFKTKISFLNNFSLFYVDSVTGQIESKRRFCCEKNLFDYNKTMKAFVLELYFLFHSFLLKNHGLIIKP